MCTGLSGEAKGVWRHSAYRAVYGAPRQVSNDELALSSLVFRCAKLQKTSDRPRPASKRQDIEPRLYQPYKDSQMPGLIFVL
jgi:hypothetical protein